MEGKHRGRHRAEKPQKYVFEEKRGRREPTTERSVVQNRLKGQRILAVYGGRRRVGTD